LVWDATTVTIQHQGRRVRNRNSDPDLVYQLVQM